MALKKAAAAPAKKTAAKAAASPAKGGRGSAPPPAAKPAPSPTVTVKQCAAEFAAAHELTKKQAETMVDDIVGLFISHLKAGDRLRISGLGILEVKNRPARTGRNPATGAVIQIAASKKIAFRPAKELKESV